MNAVAKDSPNPWNALASQNPVVHFIDVCLRGAGQVMFQNNPLTGLFFLVGIFWGAYSAHRRGARDDHGYAYRLRSKSPQREHQYGIARL